MRPLINAMFKPQSLEIFHGCSITATSKMIHSLCWHWTRAPTSLTIQGVKFERCYQVTKSMCLKTLRKIILQHASDKKLIWFFFGGGGTGLICPMDVICSLVPTHFKITFDAYSWTTLVDNCVAQTRADMQWYNTSL